MTNPAILPKPYTILRQRPPHFPSQTVSVVSPLSRLLNDMRCKSLLSSGEEWVPLLDTNYHSLTYPRRPAQKSAASEGRRGRDLKTKVRPEKKTFRLQREKARPHTNFTTTERVAKFGWTVLSHPPYSPHLAPSDFHLFESMKDGLRGQQHFLDRVAVITAVTKWLVSAGSNFYVRDTQALVHRWQKYGDKSPVFLLETGLGSFELSEISAIYDDDDDDSGGDNDRNKQLILHLLQRKRLIPFGCVAYTITVTEGGTWLHHFGPETEAGNGVASCKFAKEKKLKSTTSAGKVMAAVFFNSEELLLEDIMPHGTTINSDGYVATLNKLQARLSRV
ncbi:hypothetical protein ANN_10126 [Periplaneta americana]|uniref:Histone-lysine N-methyltransferase SETMAR n=1 Tax=Periplaneta americana TaxID=6978 RepID=A0ABQ8TRA9_PERAM|nr:hypothetical protein ANN_10126 [Periplaneta americana]